MGQQNVETYLLRTFVAVAEKGQITKAARHVNVTQSAASQQISRLERQLGVTLLDRSSNKITLSKEGQKLYVKAIRLLELNDQIVSEMAIKEADCVIRLGIPHDLVERILPPIMRKFGEIVPNVDISVHSSSTGELLLLLEQGEVDVAITTELKGMSVGTVLMEDRLVWVGAKNAQAGDRDPLIVALGDNTDTFRKPVVEALADNGVQWLHHDQPGGLGAVRAILAADVAVAPSLLCVAPNELEILDGDQLPRLPSCQICLVQSGKKKSDEIETLVGQIREFFDGGMGKA